jgi:hypothetical protein
MAVAARKKKQVELAVRARKTERNKNEFTTLNKGTAEHAWLRDCMWRLQDGKCPICDTKMRDEHVTHDHGHDEGNSRGALCKACNGALGLPENKYGDRVTRMSDWDVTAGIRAMPSIMANTRRRLERVSGWADNARAYWEKWEPVAEEMGRAYRKIFGPGMRPKSPAKGLVSMAAFVEFGNVLVRLSRRTREGMTPEQIAATRAQRRADWPARWENMLVHPDLKGIWQGEGDGWTWERYTRVMHTLLIAAQDWLADIHWGDNRDEHPEDGQRVLVLYADLGTAENPDRRGISHKETAGAPIVWTKDGRPV